MDNFIRIVKEILENESEYEKAEKLIELMNDKTACQIALDSLEGTIGSQSIYLLYKLTQDVDIDSYIDDYIELIDNITDVLMWRVKYLEDNYGTYKSLEKEVSIDNKLLLESSDIDYLYNKYIESLDDMKNYIEEDILYSNDGIFYGIDNEYRKFDEYNGYYESEWD
ncbi:hypothetical protein EAI30_15935 [Romboutsia ilealis]|uniref:Uncharacterized protein n=1 Tax=Romboutsia faecis TaxID=2764597 RepID=A0ABR7JNC5_9FIRM|nr:hypothetical protein [Romboutsia faecis]MBC5996436.1 hypothetical protein [Romboutsia faecis]MRN26104.1 hypothetical protein [Romboutsia ilealis]